jgi:hypothetical protein
MHDHTHPKDELGHPLPHALGPPHIKDGEPAPHPFAYPARSRSRSRSLIQALHALRRRVFGLNDREYRAVFPWQFPFDDPALEMEVTSVMLQEAASAPARPPTTSTGMLARSRARTYAARTIVARAHGIDLGAQAAYARSIYLPARGIPQ